MKKEIKKKKNNKFDNKNASKMGRNATRFESRNINKNSDRSRFDKPKYRVTCDQCGEKCEVPFRPTENKPIYCSSCFKKSEETKTKGSQKDLAIINEKLDKIMKALKIN